MVFSIYKEEIPYYNKKGLGDVEKRERGEHRGETNHGRKRRETRDD